MFILKKIFQYRRIILKVEVIHGFTHLFNYLFERFYIVRFPYLLYEIICNIKATPIRAVTKFDWRAPYIPDYSDCLYSQNYDSIDEEIHQVFLRAYELRFNFRAKITIAEFMMRFKDKSITNYSRNELTVNYFFYNLNKKVNPFGLIKNQYLNIIFMIFNTEYRRKNTNNHILNSYRGTLILSIFLGSTYLINYSITGLERWFKKLAPEFYLNEGSTHYAMIFNLWVSDIYVLLCGLSMEKSKIAIYCITFLKENNAVLKPIFDCSVPICIGDLSPDLPFDFIKILNIRIINWLKKLNIPSERKIKNKYLLTLTSNSLNHYIVLLNKGLINKSEYRSHHHFDDFSFVLADCDRCYLIDPGRFSYSSSDFNSVLQKSNNGHTNIHIISGDDNFNLNICDSYIEEKLIILKFSDSDNHIRLVRKIELTQYGCIILDDFQFKSKLNWEIYYTFLIEKEYANLEYLFDCSNICFEEIGFKRYPISHDYGFISSELHCSTEKFTFKGNNLKLSIKIELDKLCVAS